MRDSGVSRSNSRATIWRPSKPPVIEVRYEALVADPAGQLRRLASLAGMALEESALMAAAATVRGDRAGAGGRSLSAADLGILEHEIGDLMEVARISTPDHNQHT